jgi:hypothetical protein
VLRERCQRLALLSAEERLQQAREIRHVANEHHLARFAGESGLELVRRIVWPEPSNGGELRRRIARAPEDFRRLTRTQLPAVPDGNRFDAARSGFRREPPRVRTPRCRKRPLRIHFRPYRVCVVNEEDHQRLDVPNIKK